LAKNNDEICTLQMTESSPMVLGFNSLSGTNSHQRNRPT